MGLFDKKFCDICGEKIGLLGNKKLKDGNMCKNCQAKLSPFFRERRESTINEIKEQLAYREANKAAVAAFHPTLTFGDDTKIYIDEDAKKIAVSRYPTTKFAEANPDIIDFSQITALNITIDEDQDEVKYKDQEGNYKSFVPQRFAYSYDFDASFTVNSPYFSEINLQLNSSSVDNDVDTTIELNGLTPEQITVPGFGYDKTSNKTEVQNSEAYKKYYNQCEELKKFFGSARQDLRSNAAEKAKIEAEEQSAVTCPYCGAKTKKGGTCEFCGAPLA